MPFEDFDKKIREAADHHHPAYDEKAWNKMHKLLNKHLPLERRDRRRGLWLILLFLLVGGGVAVFIDQTSSKKSTVSAGNQVSSTPEKPVSDPSTTVKQLPEKDDQLPLDPVITIQDQTTSDINNPLLTKSNRPVRNISREKLTKDDGIISPSTNVMEGETPGGIGIEKKPNESINKAIEKKEEVNPGNKKITNETVEQKIDDPKTNLLTDNSNKEKTEKNTKTAKSNSFFFSLSAGADVSATGWEEVGKMKLLGGAGFGYTIKDRITVRTGFYMGRKVYTAEPYDYNPPSAFWSYYPNLEKVDADCKVYEIPVLVSYNFGKSPDKNWFAGAGLSTYLMKRETYNYHYKPNGVYTTRKWTIEDKNKHFFSILTVSGGYQRAINKRVSLIAEPYLKLPLSGVGYGKVKLNSAGIMVSATMQPFGKK